MANGLTEEEQKIIDAKRAQFGAICAFRPGGKLVVFRKASIGERDRVKMESTDPDKRAVVDKNIAISCCVYPEDISEARTILDEYPFVYDKAGARICQISGADVEEVGKV